MSVSTLGCSSGSHAVVVAALIWHDNTPARVAGQRLDLGTRERRLGIVLDVVHGPDLGGSVRRDLHAGVDELGHVPHG